MLPELFQFGPFHLRSFGVMLALAFLAGTWIALREARRRGLDESHLLNLVLVILVASIVGARGMYAVTHTAEFDGRPLAVFAIWEGGLTLYGGLVLGTASGFLAMARMRLPFGPTSDALTPGVALGAGVARIGCFLNGCCYGVPTTLPWGVHFPPDSFAGLEFGNAAVHPSQIYFAIAGLALFGITWALRKRFEVPGTLFWLFILLFSLVRVFLDMTRAYEPESIVATWGTVAIHESQVVSLALALFSTLMILRLRRLAPAHA